MIPVQGFEVHGGGAADCAPRYTDDPAAEVQSPKVCSFLAVHAVESKFSASRLEPPHVWIPIHESLLLPTA